MLTADLVRARVRGPTLRPIRPDPSDPIVVELAERVHEAFAAGARDRLRLGEVLGELEESVRDLGDVKLGRGLVKIAQDRCETEVGAVDDPAALRLELFRRAAVKGPLALTLLEGLDRPTAASVLAEVAAERGTEPERLADDLYADLPAERRITAFGVPDPGWLVRRYDLALVQALLLSATELKVTIRSAPMPRLRQLVRWVKFHQLLHTARKLDDGLELVLDGPMSLFGPSTRYGLALASFFPALVLQGSWTLEATVAWTRARQRKQLVVTSEDGYTSHYPDTGAYPTRTQQHFAARFAEKPREWVLADNTVPVALSDRELLFPDYELTRGDRRVMLEILGYWRPEMLERRLAALAASPGADVVFAVSRKLAGAKEGALPEHPRVVPYTDVLSVEKVLRTVEDCEVQPTPNGPGSAASKPPAGRRAHPDRPW